MTYGPIQATCLHLILATLMVFRLEDVFLDMERDIDIGMLPDDDFMTNFLFFF